MALRVAELETLFTANIKDFEKKATKVDKAQNDLAKSDPTVKVSADEKPALTSMGKVEAEAKKLDGSKAKVFVDAVVDGARKELDSLGDEGAKAGKDAGEGLSKGIIGALVALPIAGTVVGIGVAIGKSLMDGMQVEVRADALIAKTGMGPKRAAMLGRAAGEAYANNWGESIAANMDTARVAIQGGLLNPRQTAKDAQAVIESLSGVSDILGEDIPRVSRSVTQLLRTGLAKDAAGAFDLLVKGSQKGLNVSEDLLDTVDEYGTQFRKLGLSGPKAFGLLSQAVNAGARDTDTAADAVKEFSIRAVDGSKASAAAYAGLGLNASKMSKQIAAGGDGAAQGLDTVLDRLRKVKDPAVQAQIAVGLFGTKAEDMGEALFALDLSTAVQQLGNVEGAAKTAMDALGDNTAGTLATAQRNIEVAADGIKGALATAFSPQIAGVATFVTENREAVMTFMLDMANGAIDAGRALTNAAADGTEGFGSFVGTVGPQMTSLILTILEGMNSIPFVELDDAVASFKEIKTGADAGFAAFEAGSKVAADGIRENLIRNGLDPAQEKLNAVAIPLIAQAALHDASVALAKDIDTIGYAADGSKLKLATHKGAVDLNTESGRLLDEQIRAMVASMDAESTAAAASGEGQAALNTKYRDGRQALIDQLVQMGLTVTQAKALADKYGAIPKNVATAVKVDATQAHAEYKALQTELAAILAKETIVHEARLTSDRTLAGKGLTAANGRHITAAASGMDRQSMIAPGGANILWAEPETGWETYISGKPSQRARNIGLLTETARRFGLTVLPPGTSRYADGGVAQAAQPAGSSSISHSTSITHTGNIIAADPNAYRAELEREARQKALRVT